MLFDVCHHTTHSVPRCEHCAGTRNNVSIFGVSAIIGIGRSGCVFRNGKTFYYFFGLGLGLGFEICWLVELWLANIVGFDDNRSLVVWILRVQNAGWIWWPGRRVRLPRAKPTRNRDYHSIWELVVVVIVRVVGYNVMVVVFVGRRRNFSSDNVGWNYLQRVNYLVYCYYDVQNTIEPDTSTGECSIVRHVNF